MPDDNTTHPEAHPTMAASGPGHPDDPQNCSQTTPPPAPEAPAKAPWWSPTRGVGAFLISAGGGVCAAAVWWLIVH